MNYLVGELLKIHTPYHTQIQRLITDYFARCGYESRTEKTVWRDRTGRIDVFAQKGSYSVGIEIDDCAIRMNSIEKLNALKPSLAVFVFIAKTLRFWQFQPRIKLKLPVISGNMGAIIC